MWQSNSFPNFFSCLIGLWDAVHPWYQRREQVYDFHLSVVCVCAQITRFYIALITIIKESPAPGPGLCAVAGRTAHHRRRRYEQQPNKKKRFSSQAGRWKREKTEWEGEENTKTAVFKRQCVGSFDLVVNSSFHVRSLFSWYSRSLRKLNKSINLIVAPCIFVESLQFINQRMHI